MFFDRIGVIFNLLSESLVYDDCSAGRPEEVKRPILIPRRMKKVFDPFFKRKSNILNIVSVQKVLQSGSQKQKFF